MFYLTTHSTHFISGYMASDIWLRTILIVRKETRCRHIGYSYRLTARVLLYAPSHRQDNTYHGLYYTSRGALAGMRNSSMGYINKNGFINICYTGKHSNILNFIQEAFKTTDKFNMNYIKQTMMYTYNHKYQLANIYFHKCINRSILSIYKINHS